MPVVNTSVRIPPRFVTRAGDVYSTLPLNVFNVLVFGAVGDDTTDATDGVNAAISAANAAGGGVVFVPSGDFYCAGQIVMQSNVYLMGVGYGSYLHLDVADIGVGGTTLSNVQLANLRIGGAASRMVSFISPTSLRIRDCWVSGATLFNGSTYSAGIYVDVGTDVWIDAVQCTPNGVGLDNGNTDRRSADIMCYSTGANTAVRITRAKCQSTAVHFNIAVFNPVRCFVGTGTVASGAISDDGENSGYGIMFYDDDGSYATASKIEGAVVSTTGGSGVYIAGCPDTTLSDVTATNVALTQADGTLSVAGIVINDSPDAKVSDCHVNSSGGRGISIVSSPAPWAPSSGVTVTDCTVDGCELIGISSGGQTDDLTVSDCDVSDCAINIGQQGTTVSTGVSIDNCTSRDSRDTSPGIQFGYVDGFTISNNRIFDAGGQGIYAAGDTGTITGNVNIDASTGNPDTYAGIFFSGDNIACNSNTSINTGGTGHKYGIQSTSTTNCMAHDNIVSGQTAPLSLDAGTDNDGNIFTGSGKRGNLHFGTLFDTPTSGTTLLSVGSDAVTVGADRRIRVTAAFDGWYGDVAADLFLISLRADSTNIYANVPIYILAADQYMAPASITFQTTALAAGSRTFDLTAERAEGTGILQVRGRLIVDDMGPA